MDKFDRLINMAGVFFLLSFIFAWIGGSFLLYYVSSMLLYRDFDVPAWFLPAGAVLLVSSAVSYRLYRYFKRLVVEERARECVIGIYNEVIAEIRRLREELAGEYERRA
jgi:Na+/melibiose symporter-like transporter